MKIEINDYVAFKSEDSGCALIAELANLDDSCYFVRFHSYDETKEHEVIKKFGGKKVKVTIETIE